MKIKNFQAEIFKVPLKRKPWGLRQKRHRNKKEARYLKRNNQTAQEKKPRKFKPIKYIWLLGQWPRAFQLNGTLDKFLFRPTWYRKIVIIEDLLLFTFRILYACLYSYRASIDTNFLESQMQHLSCTNWSLNKCFFDRKRAKQLKSISHYYYFSFGFDLALNMKLLTEKVLLISTQY